MCIFCIGSLHGGRTQFIQKYNLNQQKQALSSAARFDSFSSTPVQAAPAPASEADATSKGGGSVLV